jgi:hypothetical protein
VNESESSDEIAPVGLCLKCGYDLRGITMHGCPECGREFDPNDPRRMHIGRRPVVGGTGFLDL